MASTLKGKDIIRADQFTLEEIALIMETAARFERVMQADGRLLNMAGKVLATLFYEPSTRTRLSFETAMLRLGGQVLSVAEAKTSSSAAKGETLFDTGKMIEGYADVAVIRHPVTGSAQELADGAAIPVLNGGDGAGQHPTQALLDLYTIRKEKGGIEDLTITLAGDLKNGRTVHSLSQLLANFGVRFNFVAPDALAMPAEITAGLRGRGIEVRETSDLAACARGERCALHDAHPERTLRRPGRIRATQGRLCARCSVGQSGQAGHDRPAPPAAVDEIKKEVDNLPGAAYFRQAANGVPVRMALLALTTGRE